MHARRHRMNRVQKRDIFSDIFGGHDLPTLSIPPIVKPTETSASETSLPSTTVSNSTGLSSSIASSTSDSSTPSSVSSTSSSTPSTSSQLPTSTAPPASTIESTAPNGSTSTIIVEASITATPSQDPSILGSGSSTGFLHNKVASGVVFALVGLIGFVLILSLIMVYFRAKRKAKLHQDAISFEPTIGPDALDNYKTEKEYHGTSNAKTSEDREYYQQTNAAFQRPGYDFTTNGNLSEHYFPGAAVQLPSAIYNTGHDTRGSNQGRGSPFPM